MIAYTWDDKLLIGHSDVDAQHRHLFEILNRLYSALKEQRSDAGTRTALDELTHYVSWHFAAEEEVMRACGFPQIEEHIAAHRAFAQQVEDLRERGSGIHAFELLNFIGYWIVKHVGQADVEIGRYLQRQAAEESAGSGEAAG